LVIVMAEVTNISWADKTWSPWTGCTRISPACDGCYAAQFMDNRMGRVEWGGPGVGEGTRDLMSEDYWKKPLRWNREAQRDGTRPTVFPSLCDPFDTAVPELWRNRFMRLVEATPNLVWLLLTKRIGNAIKLTDPCRGEVPLPRNAALGSTFANQTEWDRDWHKLRDAERTLDPIFTFASFEPLLGRVDMGRLWLPTWVIAGGETDQGVHKARPTHPDWFRFLRDQCAAAGTPFHFKQWGEYVSVSEVAGVGPHFTFPDGATVRRIGKDNTGRTLDWVEHNEFPTIRRAA
jgi:protein gp37